MNIQQNIRYTIAIASGKGGVGKSTTTVNLATTLHLLGYRVGILDADIYGPSIPTMLGIDADQKPKIEENFFIPIEAHGIQSMSLGYLLTKETPAVWRGPMASGALMQMLTQTKWQQLDFLLIDLPPGTGDIQLTLTQKLQLSGAVVVTTPQQIAIQDAIKAIEMFQKVSVPVLGVVENMSTWVCPHCQHESAIFGDQGGETLAQNYQVPLLGKIPLAQSIRMDMDIGTPITNNPTDYISTAYVTIAQSLIDNIEQRQPQPSPQIIIE